MANDALALARPEHPAAPDHYEAFYELLAASERGRAFLAEHARRGRSADMDVMLAALMRIEALMRAGTASQDNATRSELQMLVMVIRSARPQAEDSPAQDRAAKLSALVDLLEARILALAGPLPDILDAGGARARLSVVPPPDQPELPIPSPAVTVPPPLAFAPVPVAEPPPQTDRPEQDKAAAPAVAAAPAAKAATPPAAQAATPPARPVRVEPPPADPLAALMMLSEDERIALFS